MPTTIESLFSVYEIETRQLFNSYRDSLDEITDAEIIVMDVFRARSAAAMPAEQIEAIGMALHSLQTLDVRDALRSMVRAKALRSYSKGGVRLYEVNY